MFGFCGEDLERVVVVAGREEHLDELLRTSALARVSRSTGRLKAMMPPNALSGSPANARS